MSEKISLDSSGLGTNITEENFAGRLSRKIAERIQKPQLG